MANRIYSNSEKNEIINDILSCIIVDDNSSLDADRLGEICAFLISLKADKENKTNSFDMAECVRYANGRAALNELSELKMKMNKCYDEGCYPCSMVRETEIQSFVDGAKWAIEQIGGHVDENI